MKKIEFTMKEGLKFRYADIECNYSVTSYVYLQDFYNGLKWYEDHKNDYADYKVRITEGIHHEPVYQILSLSKETFIFYYIKNEEKR